MVALDGQRVGTTRTLLDEPDGATVRRTVEPGGLRVVTEAVPGVRSVALGIWVGVGSRDESVRQHGCTHYLEHVLFKGTRRRSALDISASLEAVGGELNAFTAKEYTCFYARVLDDDLPLAVDVLADMITDALVARADVDSERGVILEEIAMHDDDPADAVHDAFVEAMFGATPLGRPVLGTVDSIGSLSRSTIDGYYRRHYVPPRLVVTAAGHVQHARLLRLVRRAFAAVPVDPGVGPAPLRSPAPAPRRRPAGVAITPRRSEQANLVLGVPGLARSDDRRFALGVLNAALGGGMSSRLFQSVREQRGLAYSVYSYHMQFADAGVLGVYAGCLPGKTDDVIAVVRDELAQVARHGISPDELARGKGQMRGGLVLGLEDTGSRMTRLGKAELVHGELLGVDEVLRRIDAVTLDEVREIALLLAADPTLAVVGPFDADHRFSAVA